MDLFPNGSHNHRFYEDHPLRPIRTENELALLRHISNLLDTLHGETPRVPSMTVFEAECADMALEALRVLVAQAEREGTI